MLNLRGNQSGCIVQLEVETMNNVGTIAVQKKHSAHYRLCNECFENNIKNKDGSEIKEQEYLLYNYDCFCKHCKNIVNTHQSTLSNFGLN